MSDLQCPATFIAVRPGADDPDLAERLRGQGIARVYATGSEQDAGRRVADALAVGLASFGGADADLNDLADLHRGETVLVLGYRDAPAVVTQISIDNDGWQVAPWPT